MRPKTRPLLALGLIVAMASSALDRASAEAIGIVAFGDSGVIGSGQGRTPGGVPVAEAYPAKLEKVLQARGWDVSISNQGIRGGTARDAIFNLDLRVPPSTKLTIVQFGGNDRNLLGSAPSDIAHSLSEIIARVHAKGSAVILVRQWPAGDAPAFTATQQSADAFVNWYADLYSGGKLRPDYDSGDGAHLNAAGTDVIVERAAPDVERVLMQLGYRPRR